MDSIPEAIAKRNNYPPPEPHTNGYHKYSSLTDIPGFLEAHEVAKNELELLFPSPPEDSPEEEQDATPDEATDERAVVPAPQRIDEIDGLDGIFKGCGGIVRTVARFICRYIVMPEEHAVVVAAWVVCTHLVQEYDRFPHLAINSPEKRCGKSNLLKLINLLVFNPYFTSNISPAVLYRLIEKEKPTLIFDEAQCLNRSGNESNEQIRELYCAAIDRDTAKVYRCGGKNRDEVQSFNVYGPKVLAFIGNLESVMGDRCLLITLNRKSKIDRKVNRFKSRTVIPEGKEIKVQIEEWVGKKRGSVVELYNKLEPFDIENDRLAELMLPLQAIVAAAPSGSRSMKLLKEYAERIDKSGKESEKNTMGVRLLIALQDIWSKHLNVGWLGTNQLIALLVQREEEPWAKYSKGEAMTPEAMARLLSPYGVKSERNTKQTERGYLKRQLAEVWNRYASSEIPSNPSISSTGGKS